MPEDHNDISLRRLFETGGADRSIRLILKGVERQQIGNMNAAWRAWARGDSEAIKRLFGENGTMMDFAAACHTVWQDGYEQCLADIEEAKEESIPK